MLWTICVILIALWLFGLISGSGLVIHALLAIAAGVLIYNWIRRRPIVF